MVTLPEDTQAKWRSNRIRKNGKAEIGKEFTKAFGKTADLLQKFFEPKSGKYPTPKEHAWIVAEVDTYYAHYTQNDQPQPATT